MRPVVVRLAGRRDLLCRALGTGGRRRRGMSVWRVRRRRGRWKRDGGRGGSLAWRGVDGEARWCRWEQVRGRVWRRAETVTRPRPCSVMVAVWTGLQWPRRRRPSRRT